MISWIVITILVLVGIFAIKMNHLRHRFFIIMLILLALFLYASMTFVTTKNEVSFNSVDETFSAFKVYSGWLANGFKNVKSVTGNVIKMDWTSTNATFINKEK